MDKERRDREEVVRILEVIKTLLSLLNISNREVERRLGLHPSSLTRFFNGQVEAKLEVVLGIAREVGLEYEEFFSFAYPGPPDLQSESPTARSIRSKMAILQGVRPRLQPARNPPPGSPKESQAASPLTLTDEDVERIARAVERRMAPAGRRPRAGKGNE